MRTDGYVPMTIGRGIRSAAARGPDRVAMIQGDRMISYRQLTRRMAQVANLGRDGWKLAPGDRVALIAPNMLSYVELVAGLSDIGVIVATLNPRLAKAELAAIVADCEPRVIVVHPDCLDRVESAWADAIVVLDDDHEALLARAADCATLPFISETESFALAYTSGTTGVPKGVLLSHRSRAITFMAMAAEYGCFGPNDHFLAMAPMCHGAGFVFACAPLSFGGRVTLFDSTDMERVLARLGQRDITGIFMVPTHFARLFDLPQPMLDAHREHGLKTIISNAAALPQPMKERAIAQFGAGLLHETYGSTEGGIVTNIRPEYLLSKPGSVGVPFANMEIALRDGHGAEVADGEPGELFCRGPTTFNGYWRRPNETAEALIDGWVTVGDVARRDGDGFITIIDRKKDMVVTGGFNVYPREIEVVMQRMDGVREASVIGVPDSEWGERLHAFVVPERGRTLDPAALQRLCRDRLAGYKVPKGITFIRELPRNAGGKVLKTELRALAPAE